MKTVLNLAAKRFVVWILLLLLGGAFIHRYSYAPLFPVTSSWTVSHTFESTAESGVPESEGRNNSPWDEAVLSDLLRSFGWTLGLALSGVCMATLIFLPLSLSHAVFPERTSSRWTMIAATALSSMPTFLIATLLVYLFAHPAGLGILPATGAGPSGLLSPGFLDRTPYLLIPCSTYVLLAGSTLYRYTRPWAAEQLNTPIILAARGKGIPIHQLKYRHILPMILPSVVSLVALELSVLTGGSIVIERIFSLPGMGGFLQSAAAAGDASRLFVGLAMVSGFMMLIQWLGDVFLHFVTPAYSSIRS